MEEDKIRINKYLSQAGVLSRRKADEAIERGEVEINGIMATSGAKVSPGDTVTYKGEVVSADDVEKVILAYNKPLGLVCTSKDADKDIMKRLKDEGKLVKRDSIVHSYPHCWRCGSPFSKRSSYPSE